MSDPGLRPAEHFRRWVSAAVARVLEEAALSFPSREDLLRQFPFLDSYEEEIARMGNAPPEDGAFSGKLPLSDLRRAAGLDDGELTLFLAIGLIDEDARFGDLFEALHGVSGQPRPTVGLLTAWWREADDCTKVRSCLRRLGEFGLVQVTNPEAPRLSWALQVPAALWDALRGERPEVPAAGMRLQALESLPTIEDLVLEPDLAERVRRLPSLMRSGELRTLLVRGPKHNGRRTLLGSLARATGRSLLEIRAPFKAEDERWRLAGPLASALHAIPVFTFDLAPGETLELPPVRCYGGPVGLSLGRHGGVQGPELDRQLSLEVPFPRASFRRKLWISSGIDEDLDDISRIFRLPSGYIRQVAKLALAQAGAAGSRRATLADVREASRTLNRQVLDTLAQRVSCAGSWDDFSASRETLEELRTLESRCRHRESLSSWVGPALQRQVNCGVRALFKGPSGTGKTLAARLLAGALQMDLYRLDLSTVVNKYIGETEKNLSQVFARAEELDVILLLDEGDALLTHRTAVHNSNDRYANLETNYLLQRIESYEGILLVTTNAIDSIDRAFHRRMDVIVDFHPPEAGERWTIWQMHLPADHAVDLALLTDIAGRCQLTGGQIRNAVLHASLLSLDQGGPIDSAHLESAVRREYQKAGIVCPLRQSAGLAGTIKGRR
jgi:hypothetical protein